MTDEIAGMSSEQRFARIEETLKIAKGFAQPNRLDRMEALLQETIQTLAETNQILKRIGERHEGLAQSVEIMAAEGQRLQTLVESHERRLNRMEGK